MTYLLSEPAEVLLGHDRAPHIDTLIVGSGYGAAMAAFCLSEEASNNDPKDVWVMERGREYQPGEFPKTVAELPGHLMGAGTDLRIGDRDALFDLKLGNGVSAMVGSGLGGTSLINGGVAIDPSDATLNRWPRHHDGITWQEALERSTRMVKWLLGVASADGTINRHPRPDSLGKYRALRQIADGIRAAMGNTDEIDVVRGPEPTPLAINFTDGPNAVGVHQPACIDCGNCITGCNIGAKNTLAMNVWPLVHARGVRLFTGGTVMKLRRPAPGQWSVQVVLTGSTGDRDDVTPLPQFTIHARRVILAAGTFGSTEILKRSQPELKFSDQLGERFSVNGDMMALGLRSNERIDAAATRPSTMRDRRPSSVGPLTMSEIRVRVQRPGRAPQELSLQDGAVPFPLRRVFGELLATEHLARLFVDGRGTSRRSADPLAIDETLLSHSQLITAMGWERGRGRLELRTLRHHPDLPGEQVLTPSWQTDAAPADDCFDDVEMLLEQCERHGGFDGGQLLPCPPWRLVPKGLEVLEGFDDIGRHLVTTHPLGGCCMGTDAADGVVDTRGRVFSSSNGTAVHEGLYVMDGAIVPGPIGVNPFMTIASLTHHLAANVAGVAAPLQKPDWDAGVTIPEGTGFPLHDPADTKVAGSLRERLFLDPPGYNGVAGDTVTQLRDHLGVGAGERLVLDIEARCDDLFEWLANPSTPLPSSFRFARSPSRGDTVPETELAYLGDGPCAGTVVLGGRASAGTLTRLWRSVRAVVHFVRMRGDELWQRLRDFLSFSGRSRGDMGQFLRVTLKQAWVQSDWRYMRYAFDGAVTVAGRSRTIRFQGQKTLAYAGGFLDPLNALRRLHFSLDGSTPTPPEAPYFRVDMIRFTHDVAPFQVARTPDTPTTVLALVSTGLFLLRSIIQTHFWSFGAPGYDRYDDPAEENRGRAAPPPAELEYRHQDAVYQARLHEVPNPPRRGMRLVRYTPAHAGSGHRSALLIHGLAHGSRVFWTDTTPINLTQHLLGEGFEVWLLDHRLSCNLDQDPSPALSMEDIARMDIPWAVRTVYDAINGHGARTGFNPGSGPPQKVRVFAHCIGAGAFAMATLAGRLNHPDDPQTTMIDSAVIHAVTPWLVAAEDNRWRANVVSMFRSYFDDLAYDPIPHRRPRLAETLADRFASSFGWFDREFDLHRQESRGAKPHFARTICNRMTLFYGDEWVHANLDPRTHQNLHTLVGPAPIEVLRQVYYCIVKGRLTNREGTNEYVRHEAIAGNWTFPTLFLHGSTNKVFNADGSRMSARKLREMRALADDDASVSLRIIRGYGHMDMLFGKDANAEVFPSVSGYLGRHVLPAMDEVRLDNGPPRGEVQPPLGPVTGPIVSRPRTENGRKLLTLWSEVSQLAEHRAVVEYRSTNPLPMVNGGNADAIDPLVRIANGAAPDPDLPAADVQLAQLDVTDLAAPIDVDLTYPGCVGARPRPLASVDWAGLPWFSRAFGGHSGGGVSFLVGSCLYPGAAGEQVLRDQVFERMRPFITGERGDGVDHLLLIGDQIYADATTGLFDPAAPLERFRDRYRRAFGGPDRAGGKNAQWVLSHVPSYFAVDDHEISDNWPSDRLRRRNPRGERYGPEREFTFARGEAQSFLIHDNARPGLWYPFESGGQPFFVFDTRCERQLGPRSETGTLIGTPQQRGFRAWLDARQAEGADRAVIVTGSPLGPISAALERHPAVAGNSDTLLGYPGFLCWLHDQLISRGIQELIWLSGDAHLSCLGSYAICIDDRELAVQHIVASGLFAPLPFANPPWEAFAGARTFSHDVCADGRRRHLTITGEQRLLCSSKAHFVHVMLEGRELSIQAHTAKGRCCPMIRITP